MRGGLQHDSETGRTPGSDQALDLGRRLHRSGKLDEAESAYRSFLATNPSSAQGNAALGELLLERGHHAASIACFAACVAAEPDNAEYLNNLGYAHILNSTYEFALPHLLRAAELSPRTWRTLLNIGRAYGALGRADQGIPFLERALELAPANSDVKMMLANLLSQVADFARARDIFLELLDNPRTAPSALRGLALLTKQTSGENVLSEVERYLALEKTDDQQRKLLHQAAAKTHLDIGNADQAFHHLHAMKKLQASTFDRHRFEQEIDALRSLFSADFVASRATEGDTEHAPVFIVGMPRSGSTLLEQIVSGHSLLCGVGERPYVPIIAQRLGFGQPGTKYAEVLRTLPPGVLRSIAGGYMSLAGTVSAVSGTPVDKFLHNFLHIGLIRMLFPRARVLHARRNPMDCCFSMFTSPLSAGHEYTNDLATLGWYYRKYAELMDHWTQEFPGMILDVHYEQLVSDLEASTRRVIAFLGLPWEEGCLNFTANQRAVATISKWQVRQPLYNTSVDRWRAYEKHLRPLMDSLGV